MGIPTIKSKLKRGLALTQKESGDLWKYIKALEQQPCEDCISRKAVIKLVEQYPVIIGNRYSGLIADIEHLSSVTPKAEKWIPCSEREAKYPCLACDKYGQIFIPIGVVTIDGHSYDGLHFEFDAEKFLKGHPREIIAWMPLPQLYKAESEEDVDGRNVPDGNGAS